MSRPEYNKKLSDLLDNKNNRFGNLYALSAKDHDKPHRLLNNIEEEVGF